MSDHPNAGPDFSHLDDFATLYEASAYAVELGLAVDPETAMRGRESITLLRWRWVVSLDGGAKLLPIGPERLTAAGLFRVTELHPQYRGAFLSNRAETFNLLTPEGRSAFANVVREAAAELREVMQ